MDNSILTKLQEHFLEFMHNEVNSNTILFDNLWSIEFAEGGQVLFENGEIILSGDNGRMNLEFMQ